VWAIVAAWIVLLLGYWTSIQAGHLPVAAGSRQAFPALWLQNGLGQELISS
jgi:hypothetical protein